MAKQEFGHQTRETSINPSTCPSTAHIKRTPNLMIAQIYDGPLTLPSLCCTAAEKALRRADASALGTSEYQRKLA